MSKSLAEERPDLLEDWDFTKNIEDPYKITRGCNKKVWWKCKSGHEWQTTIHSRGKKNKGTNCPLCYHPKRGTSFAKQYPELIKQWHPYKNLPLTPQTVSYASAKRVWWVCEKDKNHEWETMVSDRDTPCCPFCLGRRVDITNCLATLRPDLAADWHPTKNTLTPYDVTCGSRKIVWWKCSKGHEYPLQVREKARCICPYCSNSKVCTDNCLETMFYEISREWDYNKNFPLKPTDVVSGSKEKVWWICSKNSDHNWIAGIGRRTGLNKSGCPFCKTSGGEKAIKEYLIKNDIKYEIQYRFLDCKNQRPLPFDFAIFDENNNIKFLIEYNGKQHYEVIDYFGGQKEFDLRQKKDIIKYNYCLDNNIDLLVIPYTYSAYIDNLLDIKFNQHQ